TKKNLESSIQTLIEMSEQKSLDHFIFYFNGRGTRIEDDPVFSVLYFVDEDKDELDECLLLSDADPADLDTYLRDDALFEFVTQIKTDAITLILDCSFNGVADNISIKGFGESTADEFDGVNVMKEGDVGALEKGLVLSASAPDQPALDGAFSTALLDALKAEKADTSQDRDLSVAEIYAYLKNALKDKQVPYLFDPQQHNPTLVTLPELPTLEIISEPSGAEVYLTKGQKRREYIGSTPFLQELQKGQYRIDVQKLAFHRSPVQDIELSEYSQSYTLEPFVLKPIGIHGIVRDDNGNPTENLKVIIKHKGKEIWREDAERNGSFHLSQEQQSWLKLDQVYEVSAIGSNLLSSERVTFTFRGYQDIDLIVPVALDGTAPILIDSVFSSSRLVPSEDLLLLGDEVLITLTVTDKVTDDGVLRDDGMESQNYLGVSSVKLILGVKGSAELWPLNPVMEKDEQLKDQHSYQFQYTVTKNPEVVEEWFVARVEVIDKGGNARLYRENEVNINFAVCPNVLAMGERLFRDGAYDKAIDSFNLATEQTDRSRYIMSLAHHELNSIQNAVESFLLISDQLFYLSGQHSGLSPLPRKFANRLWRYYLDQLSKHRQDPDFVSLLIATAERLNRLHDAELYQIYKEKLIANRTAKE
ncbi:TPA: PEGA domain-containing protein, partial [Candidatus Poribacteria bacterium]|nr:PEGA domain-containing protein [Candidatus Poribacteria bacterium]